MGVREAIVEVLLAHNFRLVNLNDRFPASEIYLRAIPGNALIARVPFDALNITQIELDAIMRAAGITPNEYLSTIDVFMTMWQNVETYITMTSDGRN